MMRRRMKLRLFTGAFVSLVTVTSVARSFAGDGVSVDEVKAISPFAKGSHNIEKALDTFLVEEGFRRSVEAPDLGGGVTITSIELTDAGGKYDYTPFTGKNFHGAAKVTSDSDVSCLSYLEKRGILKCAGKPKVGSIAEIDAVIPSPDSKYWYEGIKTGCASTNILDGEHVHRIFAGCSTYQRIYSIDAIDRGADGANLQIRAKVLPVLSTEDHDDLLKNGCQLTKVWRKSEAPAGYIGAPPAQATDYRMKRMEDGRYTRIK